MTKPTQTETNLLLAQLQQIDVWIEGGLQNDAKELALQLTEKYLDNVDCWIMLSRACLGLVQFPQALDASEKAVEQGPSHPVARLLFIDSLLRCGRTNEAFEAAKVLELDRKNDPVVVRRLGNFCTRTNRHADAARLYERARVLDPTNPALVYNLVGAHIALGDLDKAVALLDGLLLRDPREFDAYYTRATLRKWSPEHNHVAAMEKVLANTPAGGWAEAALCFAVAKELEDMGEWQRSFVFLVRGADARRRTLTYDLSIDISMMDDVRHEFDESFFARPTSGYRDRSPIFVLGMPRSGTTLVDRILSSHSKVGSVGESKEFSEAIGRCSRGITGHEIVEVTEAKQLDSGILGADFCRAVDGLLPGRERLLDKTPRNFMYLGMIAKALPNASIVHVRRRPVDSCYAVYKTLFRDAYYFSYDLTELGRYYLGYLQLMDHWRRMLPGRFLDVDYEDLVANQEVVSRRVISFCGLDWEEACLSFEKNASPSLTASAAQVRQPIYKSSVALSRHYERELEPLIRVLREGGVEIT
jgi:tetratricopeptide (TPR) repeat protein